MNLQQANAAVGLVLLLLSGCAGGEAVTATSIKAARAKWDAAVLKDYNLEWRSWGAREGHYRVFVRSGEVKAIYLVTPKGEVVAKPGNPRFYGVDGLFMLIEEELGQLDTPQPFGRPKGTTVAMRMEIDPKLGYPRKYFRDVVGSRQGITVEVIKLDVAPASEIPLPASASQ